MATDDPSNPWSDAGWNVTAQMSYHQQHGAARAAARARDAGKELGGPRRPTSGGKPAAPGADGPQRTAILKHISAGWSPLLAVVVDGARRVQRIVGWTGGQGQPPAVGKYIGPTGLVNTVAEATDIRGAPGTNGGGGTADQLTVTETAAANIGGHRVVRVVSAGNVDVASNSDPAQVGLILGITTGATVLGDPCIVQVAGMLTEPSFTFTPGPVYFDANGVLTQSVPTSGFIQQVATATSATEIVVQLGLPIVL